jgi:hypothetical protein
VGEQIYKFGREPQEVFNWGENFAMSVLVDLYAESKEEMPAFLQAARVAIEAAAAAAETAEASEEEEAPPQKVCGNVTAWQGWKSWLLMRVSRVWGVQKARGGGGRGRAG